MAENNTEKYTHETDEKEILEILSSFENEFRQNPKEDKNELQIVKYYESLELKKGNIYGVFITEEQDGNGNISRHVYFQSPSNEILSIDHEGNVKINPKWRNAIDEIDFERTMERNDEEKAKLKGISKKASSKKVEKKLENKEEQEDTPEEQIQEDLGEQEDFGISYYRPITDNSFEEQIDENLRGYEEIGLAYSKTKNAFILVGKKDGQFQQIEGFEPAQPTFKNVMSIDEDGKNVGKEVPHAIMKTNNPKKELSITIGQYGYIEVGTIDRLPCDERVKRQVGEQGEGEQGRTDPELNMVIKEKGTDVLRDYVSEKQENNDGMKVGQTRKEDVIEEITNSGKETNPNDLIPDTNITWRQFANSCGYRGAGDIAHAKDIFEEEKGKPENEGKSNQEIVDGIIKKKENESRDGLENK